MLAGVSAEYYKRLEQGRDRRPSPSVVAALGRALRLSQDEMEYVRLLTSSALGMRAPDVAEDVTPGLLRLLGSWSDTAAFVVNSVLDVVACTALAARLHPGLTREPNMVRLLFLDPAERELYADWQHAAVDCVSWLRSMAGSDPAPPQLAHLIDDMISHSDDFARLWVSHEVGIKSTGTKHLVHPHAGELHVEVNTFTVNGSAGQSLITYHVAPGSADAHALAVLAGMPRPSPGG